MLKLKSEGFDCEVKNISRFKPQSTDRWLILTILEGEVDCIFTADGSIEKAKADIATYYGFMFGEVDYSCLVYTKP